MKECCKNYLNEQFGGDADTMESVYALYVESVGEKLAEAKDALAGGDWNKLDAAAHTLKGNALAAGDKPLAEVAISLRNAVKLQATEHSTQLISQIEKLSAEL